MLYHRMAYMLIMLQLNKQPSPSKIPLVISHRGLSNLLPQNTKQAIIAGLHFSDMVEFDVLLTKDNEVVVFHDRGLKRLTNISNLTDYKKRKYNEDMDGKGQVKDDWWVKDFTFEQLKQLEVFQPNKHRPQIKKQFRISKLQQIIEECLKVKQKFEHKQVMGSGLLIQLKSEYGASTTSRDLILCQNVVKILKKYSIDSQEGCEKQNLKITLQSFNLDIVKYLSENCALHLIQLYKKQTIISLNLLKNNMFPSVVGIGVTWDNFKHGDNNLLLRSMCDSFQYLLFVWTVRDDEQFVPFGCHSYSQLYKYLQNLGVDGIITQFPDKCKAAIGKQSWQYVSDKEQMAEKCLRKVESSQ